jgi:hypothetical protein
MVSETTLLQLHCVSLINQTTTCKVVDVPEVVIVFSNL